MAAMVAAVAAPPVATADSGQVPGAGRVIGGPGHAETYPSGLETTSDGGVVLADTAQEIHLIYLEHDAITVNGSNLLAFDAGIDWDIKRVEGVSGMMGAGLFNTALQGTGWVAIVSDGPPVLRVGFEV